VVRGQWLGVRVSFILGPKLHLGPVKIAI